jgi:hypothetical protein
MAGASGTAAVAIAQAIKAAGVFVQVEPRDFQQILYRAENPLVVVSKVGVFNKKHQYLLSYRGFVFSTKSETQIHLPSGAEVVTAARVWMPM